MTSDRRQIVAAAIERLAILARPPKGEPSPIVGWQPPAEWARLGGIGGTPAAPVLKHLPQVPVWRYDRTGIAREALQALTARTRVEGYVGQYKPTPR